MTLPLRLFVIMKATSLHSPNWSQLQRGSFLIALSRRLAVPLFFLGAALLVQPCAATPFQWEYTGSLNTSHAGHTATLLPDGSVLVAGGAGGGLPSAELYHPATGDWTLTGNLNTNSQGHTATLLPNGKVLVAGGGGAGEFSRAELYDPATGTWTYTGSLNTIRWYHTGTLLSDGRVLVAGGFDNSFAFSSAELYDPATGTWTYTGSMTTARLLHTATLLPDGRVLVVGGEDEWYGQTRSSAELYDPATGTWTNTGSLHTARYAHTATLLSDGKVLVAGGNVYYPGELSSAELYDPATGTWAFTGSLDTGRFDHTATLLSDGKVLVVGGAVGYTREISSVELYDPATGTWAFTGSLNAARFIHTATLLPSGNVLVAGGRSDFQNIASAELYEPGIGTPNLVSAASRLTHRAAGSFDIDMPLSGTSGVEDRDGGGSFLAVFTFDAPVTSGNAQVVGGTATAGTPTFSGNEMRVPLSNVADLQVVIIEIWGVNEGGGGPSDVPFGFLIGDVDGNRMVAKADDNIFRADQHQVVTGSNFRDDINLSGVVDRPDHLEVKAHAHHSLP